MVYKIPTGLIKDKSPKPKKPLTIAEKEKIAEAYAKIHAKRRAEIHAKSVPAYYETRKPLDKTKKRKVVNKKEIEVVIDPKTGIIREKPHKKAGHHTLEDLKRIKVLKDEIEALKARILRKDAMIKNLKRKIEKLKDIIESPVKEEQRQLKELVDNPDFLEI